MTNIWKLDENSKNKNDCQNFMMKNGYDKNKNEIFKVGDVIQFWTGYNDDIRAEASIKGIDGDDLYVYTDCYWFPIQDNKTTKIKIIKAA